MKVLCVCHAGYVRSAATAMILKNRGFDAIAVGVNHASPETLKMLGEWADRILLAEPSMIWKLNASHHGKVERSFTIGEDEWGNPSDRDLWKLIYNNLPEYLLGDDSGDLFYRNE
jgi:predicted protein tyrosine phosphatase